MSTLFVVGLPIGNIGDITQRALVKLSELRYLIVEDSRSAGKIIRILAQQNPEIKFKDKEYITSYKGSSSNKLDQIKSILDNGNDIGLISDAGMPAISDPGSKIVDYIRRTNHQISVLPGPSAMVSALSLCGFASYNSIFIGFLPKKKSEIKKVFEKFIGLKVKGGQNIVFFESPKRIQSTILLLKEMVPDEKIFIGRELTKIYEELIWKQLSQINTSNLVTKGEYVAVLNIRK
jgi:16S rRNA (cytidine1402-2'-O)-methyltransferase